MTNPVRISDFKASWAQAVDGDPDSLDDWPAEVYDNLSREVEKAISDLIDAENQLFGIRHSGMARQTIQETSNRLLKAIGSKRFQT